MEFPTSNDPLYHSKTLDAFRFQTQQLNQLYTWNNHIRLNVRPISYDMFFPKQQEHLNTSKRYWSQEEHALFVKAIEYLNVHSTKGLPVKIISRFVGTRTPVQVRTHAQKYFECEAKDVCYVINSFL
ncbi:Myb-like domain-containing protein [Entamoeba marina]